MKSKYSNMTSEQKISFFSIRFMAIILLLMVIWSRADILNEGNLSSFKLYFTYSTIAVAIIAVVIYLYQIIISKTYKEIYPFKIFLK